MSAITRGFRYAAKAADCSIAPRYKVGAAIFKGSRLVSMGWNHSRKTHPASQTRYNAIHAEFSAIIGNYKQDLSGASIFVFRKNQLGIVGMAKPCDTCQKIIEAAGISKIFFTNREGQFEQL